MTKDEAARVEAELVNLAIEAGDRVLEVYVRGDIEWTLKSDGSPVTSADRAADAFIVERLSALFPTIPVVSEERADDDGIAGRSDRFFLVDPLDGTKEFLAQNGEFTINIALVEHGEPVVGVVHAPAFGTVYAGGASLGARRAAVKGGRAGGWRAIHVRPTPAAGARVVVSRSHTDRATRQFMEGLAKPKVTPMGSALKFCRVAEGAANLYPRLGPTMQWDTAAGDAVLRAAGGAALAQDGAPLSYGRRTGVGSAGFRNPPFVASGSAASGK